MAMLGLCGQSMMVHLLAVMSLPITRCDAGLTGMCVDRMCVTGDCNESLPPFDKQVCTGGVPCNEPEAD